MENQENPAGSTRPTRRCPFCAEEIYAEAVKCRHCGEFLSQGRPAGHAPTPPPGGGMPGWVIVLIVGAVAGPVVIAIIAIIAAIAIPNLLESKKVANEYAAIATLRTLTSAQEVYAAKWGCYANAGELGPFPGQGLIDGFMADMSENSSIKKSGYFFRMSCAKDRSSWCAVAWPINWDVTGTKKYFIDADGTIMWSRTENTNPDWHQSRPWNYLGDY